MSQFDFVNGYQIMSIIINVQTREIVPKKKKYSARNRFRAWRRQGERLSHDVELSEGDIGQKDIEWWIDAHQI